ncbi:MAG: LytTR family transcriptional regulator [Lewinellaceae bacterium]|nr:LytTR family transcriptional regulator [Saprospiraceae bacterium]MCB9312529.1 LytTR family transcriptional regulator [Lewinellaceae bacterium]
MNAQPLSPAIAWPDHRKLALPILEGWMFLPTDSIRYLEAQGSYTLLHLSNGQQVLVSRNLAALAVQIDDPVSFVRIHRSYIVHLAFLEKFVKTKSPTLQLDDGTALPLSLQRKEEVLEAMQQFFRF